MISRRSKTVLTAYQKARLQVVGYRSIQSDLAEILSKHDLNISQWIILGWLSDTPEGMRVTALAEILRVETPLVTTLIGPLQKKKLVTAIADVNDKRAKLLSLTEAGDILIRELENELADVMSAAGYGMKKNEFDAYFAALDHLVHHPNGKR